MYIVDWQSFSWEAFATLATGALAVGAAVYVGRLQHQIMTKQQQILDHQARIERLSVRADTFQLRWEVYEATANWLAEWLQTGERPRGEIAEKFRWALEKSKFLFRPEVAGKLEEWRLLQLRQHYINRHLERDQTPEDRQRFENMAVENDRLLSAAFGEIVPLFSHDMALSETDHGLPPLPQPPREDELER